MWFVINSKIDQGEVININQSNLNDYLVVNKTYKLNNKKKFDGNSLHIFIHAFQMWDKTL